jgi:hypothetical protein
MEGAFLQRIMQGLETHLRSRRLQEASAVFTLLVLSFFTFSRSAEGLQSKGDEWIHIYSSRYFANLYANNGPSGAEWLDNYWTHDHPMVSHYVRGAWLSLRGYDLYGLPEAESSYLTSQNDFVVGPTPNDPLLGDSRSLMVLLGMAGVILAFLVGRTIYGILAGFSAAGLMLSRPLFAQELVLVQIESLLVALLLLALLVAILGVQRGAAGALPKRWAVVLGVVLGLAFGAKLTAGFSILSIGAFAAGAGALAFRRDPAARLINRLRASASVLSGWALALAITFAVFVASNPHLYSNPLVHTTHIFTALGNYMDRSAQSSEFALSTLPERIGFVLRSSLMGIGTTGSEASSWGALRALAGILLAGAGFVAMSMTTLKALRERREMPWEGLALTTILIYFLGVSVVLEVGWQRYVVPTAVFGAVLFGVGVEAVCRRMVTSLVGNARLVAGLREAAHNVPLGPLAWRAARAVRNGAGGPILTSRPSRKLPSGL